MQNSFKKISHFMKLPYLNSILKALQTFHPFQKRDAFIGKNYKIVRTDSIQRPIWTHGEERFHRQKSHSNFLLSVTPFALAAVFLLTAAVDLKGRDVNENPVIPSISRVTPVEEAPLEIKLPKLPSRQTIATNTSFNPTLGEVVSFSREVSYYATSSYEGTAVTSWIKEVPFTAFALKDGQGNLVYVTYEKGMSLSKLNQKAAELGLQQYEIAVHLGNIVGEALKTDSPGCPYQLGWISLQDFFQSQSRNQESLRQYVKTMTMSSIRQLEKRM